MEGAVQARRLRSLFFLHRSNKPMRHSACFKPLPIMLLQVSANRRMSLGGRLTADWRGRDLRPIVGGASAICLSLSSHTLISHLSAILAMSELVFSTVDGVDISLDYYLPPNASKDNPAPILIWWHGGGLLQVRKCSNTLPQSSTHARCCRAPAKVRRLPHIAPTWTARRVSEQPELTSSPTAIWKHLTDAPEKHNLCVISPDYRLAPQTRLSGILFDIASLLFFVRSPAFLLATNHSVDPSKLFVSGGSAGGWLALLAGTGVGFKACGLVPAAPPTAICAIYPISDLEDPFWTTVQRPVSYFPRVIEREEMEEYLDPEKPQASMSKLESTRSNFYHYMVHVSLVFRHFPVVLTKMSISGSRVRASRDSGLRGEDGADRPSRFCRGILSSLLLDGTGISPKAFSIAPAIVSGEFTAAPTFIVHGTFVISPFTSLEEHQSSD